MQIIAATRRLRRAKTTSQSITEQHSPLDDDALARLDAASEKHLIALLECDVHGPRLEPPRRGLDKHLADVILEYQCVRRCDRHFMARRMEVGGRKHSGPQAPIGIVERDADFG